MPVRVTLAVADTTLYGDDPVRTGAGPKANKCQHNKDWCDHKMCKFTPSKLNTMDDVPTTPAAVIPAVPTSPSPRMPMHAADDAVVQLLVAQSANPSTAVSVA